ncbi:hypothetical protein JTB14_028155 [Gonioctena quinquepunctata]|nr:hypothetical protein JTB14_028155 [Gonioctena quinquepunctata]
MESHSTEVSKCNSREITYDEGTRSRIGKIVHDFFLEILPATVDKILDRVNRDDDLPNFHKTTLRRLLSDIGFVYGKRGRDSLLMERNDIITWRRRYLRKIGALREKNVNLIYTDESWTNIGASVKNEWKDTTIKKLRDAFVKGLTTGLKAPIQRGPRSVLLHAGTEEGFVDGELPFLDEKGAEGLP